MIVPGSANLLLAGADEGYQIQRSLRFNSADSAYLNRTFSAPTSNYIWTWSAWIKRSTLGTDQTLFGVAAGNSGNTGSTPRGSISWDAANTLSIFANDGSTTFLNIVTTPVFRDASAWYHVMFVLDTTQATNTNRVKIYINGVQQTVTGTYPNQNVNTIFNGTSASKYHSLGMYANLSQFANGYLTEVNFIDGQALTPSDFGETDSATGVWKPKKFSGTYGTNGFYLNFSDNSNTTSTTLGKDSSGNGNNWTPNLFSVTAGTGNDSLVDTPTSYGVDTGVGGEVRGNYCTWNSVDNLNSVTLSNGNLQVTGNGTTARGIRGTLSLGGSTPFYFEYTNTTNFNINYPMVGICAIDEKLGTGANDSATGPGKVIVLYPNGANWGAYSNGSLVTSGTATAYSTNGSIVMFAWDPSTGKFWMGVGGTWHNSGNPAAGTNPTGTISSFIGLNMTPTVSTYSTSDGFLNCGQRPFAYTAPSGFKALCTQNLPTPTIGATSTTQANRYFDILLETGTGSARSVTGLNFQPDFLWAKGRNASSSHLLYDAVRGVDKSLNTNNTLAEDTTAGQLTSFNSNGYSLPNDTAGYLNFNGRTYAFWNWKANGAGSSNTAGTITSTVSANTTAGFSIVTYTGNGTSGATVGHGLGVAPNMIIIKNRTDSASAFWCVYHSSAFVSGADPNVLYLNSTQAQTDDTNVWGTSPAFTSTTFKLGDYNGSNGNGDSLVAYCFAAVAGYSAFGSYTGNGSTDGPFVYTGFRPRFVMIKSTTSADSWVMLDTSRDTYNVANKLLYPNLSNSEATFNSLDFNSNGFKQRNTDTAQNANGSTYIYAAFAESPFKYSLGR